MQRHALKRQQTEVPVPNAWLKTKYLSLGDYYFDCEEQANELATNCVNTVWEDYVIGLELTASDARFVALIENIDGVPKVMWAERVFQVQGARGRGSAADEGARRYGVDDNVARGSDRLLL